jgi:hypothetical protein
LIGVKANALTDHPEPVEGSWLGRIALMVVFDATIKIAYKPSIAAS